MLSAFWKRCGDSCHRNDPTVSLCRLRPTFSIVLLVINAITEALVLAMQKELAINTPSYRFGV